MLNKVQQRANKMLKGLEQPSRRGRLWKWGLFDMKKRQLLRDLTSSLLV